MLSHHDRTELEKIERTLELAHSPERVWAALSVRKALCRLPDRS